MMTTRKCVLFASAIVSSVAFGGTQPSPPTYPVTAKAPWNGLCSATQLESRQLSPITFPVTPDDAVMSTDQFVFASGDEGAYSHFRAEVVKGTTEGNINNVWSLTLDPTLLANKSGHTVSYNGNIYKFDKVRLHAHAEHRFHSEEKGRAAEIEIEYVYTDANDVKSFLYVSVTVAGGAKGEANLFIKEMLKPKTNGVAVELSLRYGDIKILLDSTTLKNAQVYDGSSTIPNCEAAQWLVFTEPIVISNEQVTEINEYFNIAADGYEGNVRPANAVNERAHIKQQTFTGAGKCAIALHEFGKYVYPENLVNDGWNSTECKSSVIQQSPIVMPSPSATPRKNKVEFNANFDGAVINKWVVGLRKDADDASGHVIEAYLEATNINDKGMMLTINDTDHYFKGVYLHGEAEHRFPGESTARAAELQFVFGDSDDTVRKSILSVTFQQGAKAENNVWFDKMLGQITAMRKLDGKEHSRVLSADLFNDLNISNVLGNSALTDADATLISYNGTFTTPNCDEATWYVFNDAIDISAAQVSNITALFHRAPPSSRRTLVEVPSFRGTPTQEAHTASQDKGLSQSNAISGNARPTKDKIDGKNMRIDTLTFTYIAKDSSASTTKAASSAAIIAIMATVALMM